MRRFVVLMALTALIAAPAAGQTRRGKKRAGKSVKATTEMTDAPAAPPTVEEWKARRATAAVPLPAPVVRAAQKTRPVSDVLNPIVIDVDGVRGMRLPADLIEQSVVSTAKVNGNVRWHLTERSWRQAGIEFPAAFEVTLRINTYENVFAEIVPELKPEMATPENLNLIGLLADIKKKNEPDSPVKEAKVLEIGGIAGEFFVVEYRSTPPRLLTGWSAYRYYKGKAQEISLTIESRTDEAETARRLIESLTLDAANR